MFQSNDVHQVFHIENDNKSAYTVNTYTQVFTDKSANPSDQAIIL